MLASVDVGKACAAMLPGVQKFLIHFCRLITVKSIGFQTCVVFQLLQIALPPNQPVHIKPGSIFYDQSISKSAWVKFDVKHDSAPLPAQ